MDLLVPLWTRQVTCTLACLVPWLYSIQSLSKDFAWLVHSTVTGLIISKIFKHYMCYVSTCLGPRKIQLSHSLLTWIFAGVVEEQSFLRMPFRLLMLHWSTELCWTPCALQSTGASSSRTRTPHTLWAMVLRYDSHLTLRPLYKS